MASVQKELDEIVKAVEERGFDVVEAEGHKKVYYEGRPVLFEANPGDPATRRTVTMPSTPSDDRWRENLISTLVKSRVLDEDPKLAGQRGLSEDDLERRETERQERDANRQMSEAARRGQAAEAQARQAATDELRERAERVLGRLGVWQMGTRGGSGGTRPRRSISEAARVSYVWADGQEREGMPASIGSTEQAMKRLYSGDAGLSDASREHFAAFLDEIEQADDPHEFYFGLVREYLGLSDDAEGDDQLPGAAEPEPEPDEPEPEAERHGVEPLHAEAEDDPRVRDLREALDEKQKELDEALASLRSLRETTEAEGARWLAAEENWARELEDLRRASGGNGKVPELALEVLAEVVGQYVTVAGEDGSANLADVMETMSAKKEKALELARRIAELELSAP